MSLDLPSILIVSNTAWSVSNFRSGLIRNLKKHQFRVFVSTPVDNWVDDVRGLGVEFIPLDIDNKGINPIKDIFLILKLKFLLQRLKPDLVLNYTIKPVIYGSFAARFSKTRVINVITGLGSVFIKPSIVKKLVIFLYRFTQGPCVERLCFLNNGDYEEFVRLGICHRIACRVLPGEGVDVDFFSITETFSSSRDVTKFLFVGRVLGDKGIRECIEAIGRLQAQGLPVELGVLGFLDAENPTSVAEWEMKDWVSKGLCRYLGSTKDVRGYINEYDVVVLPSYREGLSRTLLEAGAMGKPVVGTNVPGCKEIVLDGITGFLCEPKDVDSLADCLRRMTKLSHDEFSTMGSSARRYIVENFSERVSTDILMTEIKSVLDAK